MTEKKKKTGGRKKGTPNKDKQSLLELIREEVGEADYHPVVELARQAVRLKDSLDEVDDENGLTLREKEQLMTAANREVSQYVAPKLKSVEVSGTGDDGEITVVIRKFTGGD